MTAQQRGSAHALQSAGFARATGTVTEVTVTRARHGNCAHPLHCIAPRAHNKQQIGIGVQAPIFDLAV